MVTPKPWSEAETLAALTIPQADPIWDVQRAIFQRLNRMPCLVLLTH